jgi:NAD(P)-dependent dehydrogenase (short-subunit alcohol dehydrogenase family)
MDRYDAYRLALGPAWAPVGLERLRRAVGGRVVVVTGASSGIGERTAELVGRAGATVVLAARRGDRLDAVAARIAARGGAASPHVLDLADLDDVDRFAIDVVQTFGRVDVVVSSAGKSIRRSLADTEGRFHDVTRTEAVNYLGPVRLLSALLPHMRERGRGHVVDVSTVSVDLPAAHWAVYTASTSAFDAWLRCVAPEVRADGVATTSVHFPLVHTPMSAPTYDPGLPGLTAEQAAGVIGRVLVSRPRQLTPWWVRAAAPVVAAAPGPYDAMTARLLRRGRG